MGRLMDPGLGERLDRLSILIMRMRAYHVAQAERGLDGDETSSLAAVESEYRGILCGGMTAMTAAQTADALALAIVNAQMWARHEKLGADHDRRRRMDDKQLAKVSRELYALNLRRNELIDELSNKPKEKI